MRTKLLSGYLPQCPDVITVSGFADDRAAKRQGTLAIRLASFRQLDQEILDQPYIIFKQDLDLMMYHCYLQGCGINI